MSFETSNLKHQLEILLKVNKSLLKDYSKLNHDFYKGYVNSLQFQIKELEAIMAYTPPFMEEDVFQEVQDDRESDYAV